MQPVCDFSFASLGCIKKALRTKKVGHTGTLDSFTKGLLVVLIGSLTGEKPTVRIEGDVQLAAEVNWLADHVRWDVEEDLARLLGDAPAHALAQAGRALAQGLRQIAARLPGGAADAFMNAGAPRP